MIRTISATAALLILAACGNDANPGKPGADGGGDTTSAPAALATNPPISASDIDQIVADERNASAPTANAAAPATPR